MPKLLTKFSGESTTHWLEFLRSGEFADVTFHLEKQNCKQGFIRAHKLVLAKSSKVFKAMFYGHFECEKVIRITDASYDTFEAMLVYVYGGDVDVNSLDDLFDLYELTDKYDVEHLRNECVEWLKTNATCEESDELVRARILDYVKRREPPEIALSLRDVEKREKLAVVPYYAEVFRQEGRLRAQLYIKKSHLLPGEFVGVEVPAQCKRSGDIATYYENFSVNLYFDIRSKIYSAKTHFGGIVRYDSNVLVHVGEPVHDEMMLVVHFNVAGTYPECDSEDCGNEQMPGLNKQQGNHKVMLFKLRLRRQPKVTDC